MTQPAPNYSARSASVGQVGRTLNTIRQHAIVIESPAMNGEINSGEAFLVGISSCGVTLIEAAAQQLGIGIQRMEVQIDGYRQPDVAAFEHIDMRFTFVGPSENEAAVLVGRYRDG